MRASLLQGIFSFYTPSARYIKNRIMLIRCKKEGIGEQSVADMNNKCQTFCNFAATTRMIADTQGKKRPGMEK